MRSMLISAGVGLALFASCGLAVGQANTHGFVRGGAIHGSGGGGFHGPGGGGFGTAPHIAPRMMPHSNFQAPLRYRAERTPRMQYSYRAELTRRAGPRHLEHLQRTYTEETRRAASQRYHSQRVRHELRQGNVHMAIRTDERAAQERRRREEKGRLEQHVTQRHTEIQNARIQLNGENKERLHRAFDMNRARVHNVNFEHHVGRRIPRHIHLFPIPAAVFAFFPYYEDYSYFVVDDDICIVDPRTYVVVDVIDAAYWNGPPRPHVAGLHLSAHQIAIVRESIPADFPDLGLHLRLALGAEIPEYAALHEFAPFVLDRVAQLRDYRFLVADDQIVIVQPRDRSIALVIERV
jgi:hypothetical protein